MYNKGQFLEALLKSKQTVFSAKDVRLIWKTESKNSVDKRLNYYVKQNKLIHLRKGIYAKTKDYNPYELAMKIIAPAYISFETVFLAEGMTFQYWDSLLLASYKNFSTKINGQKFEFIRMKKEVLNNTLGLLLVGGYTIASKERAMLDRIYISKTYYFDNLRGIDWGKVYAILPIYKNKKMVKVVRDMEAEYKNKYK